MKCKKLLLISVVFFAMIWCGYAQETQIELVEENTTKKVGTLAERAKAVNYIPPPFKYNLELDRDVTPLLMEPEKTALLVIDVQNGFTEPGAPMAVPDGPEVVVQINKLVDYCRPHDIPIVWVQITHRKDGSDLGIIGKYWKDWGPPKSVLARGSHWWELYPELHNEPVDIYVTKPKYNAFWGSDLEAVLRGLGVESLIFTGFYTGVCVQTTLVDAFHRDFNPIIAVDATGPYNKEVLSHIEMLFGRALTTDETIAELKALTKTSRYRPDPAYKE